ncbi:MAG: M18 family aminopeptidase [Spirochaetes bacterium]|nr:M18 family aminopeptidase [Spirochaetota bacterium]
MDILEYLDNSPAPAWAAENAATLLKTAGFHEVTKVTADCPRKIIMRPHAGMLFAAVLPEKKAATPIPLRIVGAHTDSPHLRLKPNALQKTQGHSVLASEIYGGMLNYTWFDRELGVAGEVFYKVEDRIARKLVQIKKPVAIVPSLAIHLQRGVNEDGFAPPKAASLNALFSLAEPALTWHEYLARETKIAAENILSYDLSLFDLRGAARGGFNDALLFSGRLDNLVSCFTATRALATTEAQDRISAILLFDHEEIGSVSESGAETQLTTELIAACANAAGVPAADLRTALGQSLFLSADMAHAVHPHFAEKHDTENRPRLGGGVTLKVNQNRRYASSAATQAVFHDLCMRHGIASQIYTHRNDLPCGSTIGPIVSARLGVPTLDVGVAMLGMHSSRETCAWDDLAAYQNFMTQFFAY